ncbi:Cyanohydrin beta-glucosyltransferase [Hordeum vulgare]|nr:Cyanohydrin beta-glucosyltransferase [Hordeum vulgare]
MRLSPDTFETAGEEAHAYDAAELAPPPRLVTAEEHQRTREQEERLLVAEHDERDMARWRQQFCEDVVAEHAFWDGQRAVRVAARAERRARKAAVDAQLEEDNPVAQWADDDPRWDDLWLSSEYTTTDDDE